MWWLKRIVAVLFVGTGAVWFMQGIGVAKGSPMTGHIFWSFAGAVLMIAAVALWVFPRRRLPDR